MLHPAAALVGVMVGVLIAGATGAHHLPEQRATAAACAAAASQFSAALADPARARALQPFTPELRQQWSYRAGAAFRRQGLRTGDMSDGQRRLMHVLIRCGLSTQGYQKTAGIMQLDDEVRARAGQIVMFDGQGPVEMGQEWFWVTLFGDPVVGASEPWGFQLEGHHLALNFTVVGNRVAGTPAFWGAWPATVESGPRAGYSVLAGEERGGFDLLVSLDSAQRSRAIVSPNLPPGIFTSPERKASLEKFEGVPASALSPAQQALLWRLVAEYVGNFAPGIADEWLERIADDGLDRLHLAWMGPEQRGQPVYYRIHGPSVLIEFDHAINITSKALEPDPNHIHTIVRHPGADLGEDLLARHYARSADHGGAPGAAL
ncbi:MAG: DUF3500 domain-containing protein [Gammaproteobacteria bacterium]